MRKVSLRDLSAVACAEAIDRMTEAVATELDQLVVEQTLRFQLLTPQGALTERDFFQHIVRQGHPVGDNLHRLLVVLGDQWRRRAKSGFHDLWHDGPEGVEALGYALDALIDLHPDAIEAVDPYLELSDYNHANFTTLHIAPKYFRSLKTWTDRHRFAAIRNVGASMSAAVSNSLLDHVAADKAITDCASTILRCARDQRDSDYRRELKHASFRFREMAIPEAKLAEIVSESMESIDQYVVAILRNFDPNHPVVPEVMGEFPRLASALEDRGIA